MKKIQNSSTWLAIMVTCIIWHVGCKPKNLGNMIAYPKEIANLQAEAKFDEAKWAVYRFYSQCRTNILCKAEDGSIDTLYSNVSFLTLPLTMSRAIQKSDTLIFNFFFLLDKGFIEDNPPCSGLNGIGFVGSSDSIRFFDFGDHWMRLNREEYALSFDEGKISQTFKLILRNEQNELDPWVVNEAKKRGIL